MEKQGSESWQQGGRKIDLNSASKEELMTLRGVSDKRADQILTYREQHGGFSSLDELKDVEGFSDILTDDFRAALTISGKGKGPGPSEKH